MSDDLEALEEIAERNDYHVNTRDHRGRKRSRIGRKYGPTKGSLRSILSRAKGRRQHNITLASADIRRPS